MRTASSSAASTGTDTAAMLKVHEPQVCPIHSMLRCEASARISTHRPSPLMASVKGNQAQANAPGNRPGTDRRHNTTPAAAANSAGKPSLSHITGCCNASAQSGRTP